ncbi:MAG: LysM peptidoglycan-binding domain-containing protein [Ignavibacteriales bacterium]|nr:MAG: LysM peptidoglycan-binding domain-containing protein [Ignavibacteriaceae bacterium]MBW7873277.1 LysM peptidoglycan-binding domain-containing protein [Ignavibacteria bacterium]MCZ2143015.1 LysM peptidoglycan-binding domain-containing protein [Ignavibacteriales bacterium]OQY77480.1 MAG: hypothetical protein B6D45_02845 [Ignavibacteriales bacterium UTCHB3]MBV6444705.1 hypothetical protein [Ignavibacteriaceae bacterium]
MKFSMKMVALAIVVLSASMFAQRNLSCDEYKTKMDSLRAVEMNLSSQVDQLNKDVANLQKQADGIQSYEDCLDDLYKSLDANASDVSVFAMKVNELKGKIERREEPFSAREAELAELQRNKLSALPEFYNTLHVYLPDLMNKWRADMNVAPPKNDKEYTVVKGDCLWCIAARDEWYGKGAAWPAIWRANQEVIGNNPDLIFPNQVYTIPDLTADEINQVSKMGRNYKPAP